MSVTIREEQPDEHEAVEAIHRTAFGRHGAAVAALVSDLRTSLPAGRRLSLVADEGSQIVGHVMFTPTTVELDAETAPAERSFAVYLLSPLGVLPAHQKVGVGSTLVRAGLDAMAEWGVPAVFVEGDPRYYRRFGFAPAGAHGFHKPSPLIPDAAFQYLELAPHEPWMMGALVYPDVFWRHNAVGPATA